MSKMLSGRRCKCGVHVTVVAETTTGKQPAPVSATCPKCGAVHTIYADKVIFITADGVNRAEFISESVEPKP
jgi:hypothetical protein